MTKPIPEEKSTRPDAGTGDEIERQARRDRDDQLELMAGVSGVLRRGGIILGLLIALSGWYLSREGGTWFLIGGLALGALTAGSLALSSLLGGFVIRKYVKNRDDEPGGKPPRPEKP